MQSAKQRQNVLSLKPIFVQSASSSEAKCRRRVSEATSKLERSHGAGEAPERQSNPVLKNRHSDIVKYQNAGSILADNFVGRLDQYHQSISDQATGDIDTCHAESMASLENLSLDATNHFEHLTAIGETFTRPLSTEILIIQVKKDGDNVGGQEFSLQARLTAFRHLRQEKQQVLTRLWDEWEAVQMRIITLTVEICRTGAFSLGQDQASRMKDGQQEQYDTALVTGQKLHDRKAAEFSDLDKELHNVEEGVGDITRNTNHALAAMQEKFKDQRSKLFKGLQRHIELLASL